MHLGEAMLILQMYKEYHKMKRMFIFFSFCFLYACVDTDDNNVNANSHYFTRDFAEEIIHNPSLRDEVSVKNIIFDRTRAEGLKIYGGVAPFETMFSDTINSLDALFIEYMNYNIILLVERIDEIDYVRDFIILEKQYPETHLAYGPVEINHEYFDWEIIVVVNRHWLNLPYTGDISYAFKINVSTKRIEPYPFETIRLFSEV